jgi:hypothetical protein
LVIPPTPTTWWRSLLPWRQRKELTCSGEEKGREGGKEEVLTCRCGMRLFPSHIC